MMGVYTNQPTSAGSGSNPAVVQGANSVLVQLTATENISGNQIVRVTNSLVYPVNSNNYAPNAASILGMAMGGATSGNPVTVISLGLCSGASNLVVDSTYYLGPDGFPTTTPPVSGWFIAIGTARDSSTYYVDIQIPVFRV